MLENGDFVFLSIYKSEYWFEYRSEYRKIGAIVYLTCRISIWIWSQVDIREKSFIVIQLTQKHAYWFENRFELWSQVDIWENGYFLIVIV